MKTSKTANLTFLGIFSALIILMTFTPVGYLTIPGLGISATLVHIPVIIGAVVLGTKNGVILGAVWGITCIIRAATMPVTVLDPLFVNPLLSLVPRVIVGLVAGLVFTGICRLLKNRNGSDIIASIVSAIAGTLTNTILVLGVLYTLYGKEVLGSSPDVQTTIALIFGTVIAVNGLIELGTAAVLTPAIGKALFTVKKRMGLA